MNDYCYYLLCCQVNDYCCYCLLCCQVNDYYCSGRVLVPALLDTYTVQSFLGMRTHGQKVGGGGGVGGQHVTPVSVHVCFGGCCVLRMCTYGTMGPKGLGPYGTVGL